MAGGLGLDSLCFLQGPSAEIGDPQSPKANNLTLPLTSSDGRCANYFGPHTHRLAGQYLHFLVRGTAVRALLSAESESPEAGPVLRLRAGFVRAGPSGPGMARHEPGPLFCCAPCRVARYQEPMAPDNAPAELGGVSSI